MSLLEECMTVVFSSLSLTRNAQILTLGIKIAKDCNKKMAWEYILPFLLNQSCRRIEIHSNNPSIVTDVPLVRGLSQELASVPNSENVLHIPEPDSSEEDNIISFLESLARE